MTNSSDANRELRRLLKRGLSYQPLKKRIMKTKISVEIHKSGSENDALLRMVANINEEKAGVTVNDVMGYLNTRTAMYPFSQLSFRHEHPNFSISEDGGKTFTLTLTWKEVHELEPSNDLPEELFQR